MTRVRRLKRWRIVGEGTTVLRMKSASMLLLALLSCTTAALATGACAGFGVAGRLFPLFAAPDPTPHPLAPRAKRAIMFVLTGGMSHMDSFDPKPELAKRHGEKFGRSPGGTNGGRLTCRHDGRDFRLTDVFGNVVRHVMA